MRDACALFSLRGVCTPCAGTRSSDYGYSLAMVVDKRGSDTNQAAAVEACTERHPLF